MSPPTSFTRFWPTIHYNPTMERLTEYIPVSGSSLEPIFELRREIHKCATMAHISVPTYIDKLGTGGILCYVRYVKWADVLNSYPRMQANISTIAKYHAQDQTLQERLEILDDLVSDDDPIVLRFFTQGPLRPPSGSTRTICNNMRPLLHAIATCPRIDFDAVLSEAEWASLGIQSNHVLTRGFGRCVAVGPRPQVLLLDSLLSKCRPGDSRAVTVWLAHRADDPTKAPFVVKDALVPRDHPDEGRKMRMAAFRGVRGIARYYHHETLETFQGQRGGDFGDGIWELRRVVTRDYGRSITTASSLVVLLRAMHVYVDAHKTLVERMRMVHRNISFDNLRINEDATNPSQFAFIINFDCAGDPRMLRADDWRYTKPFGSTGLNKGRTQTFVDDLEALFWVLLWVCIRYEEPGREGRSAWVFEGYRDARDADYQRYRQASVGDAGNLRRMLEDRMSPFYRPLEPCLEKLRALLFPEGHQTRRREKLHKKMKSILREAELEMARAGY